MNEYLHDIEDIFHDAIEPHEELPPEGLWDKIDLSLDKTSLQATTSKYKNLKRLSILLSAFSFSIIVFELARKTTGPNIIQTKHTAISKIGNVTNQENPATTADLREVQKFAFDATETKEPAVIESKVVSTLPLPLSLNLNNIQPNSNKTTDDKFPIPTTVVSHSAKRKFQASKEKSNFNRYENNFSEIRVKQNRPIAKETKNQTNDFVVNTTKNSPNQALADGHEQWVVSSIAELMNKKKISFTVALPGTIAGTGIVFKTSATKSTVKSKRKFEFSISPYFAPLFYFDNIAEGDQHSAPGRNAPDHVKGGEDNLQAYSLGLHIQVLLKKRWSVETGLGYTSRNEGIDAKKIYAVADNSGTVKYRFDFPSGSVYLLPKNGAIPAVGDSGMTTASNHHLQYLAIPLTLNYTFFKSRFNIIPSIGVMMNVLLADQLQTGLASGGLNEKQIIRSVMALKKINFQSITSVSFQYNVGKKISLSLTPAVNFALSNINSQTSYKSYPNAARLAGGLRFYF